MLQKLKHHVKKHGHKVLAATLVIALIAVAIQYRPSQFKTASAAGSSQWVTTMTTDTPNGDVTRKNTIHNADGTYMTAWAGGDGNIYVQKLSALGATQWGSDLQLTNLAGNEPVAVEYDSEILGMVSDGSNGAYISYTNDNAGARNVYVERVTSAGSNSCSSAALTSGTAGSDNQQLINIASDNAGGVYAAWQEENTSPKSIWLTRLDNTCSTVTGWPQLVVSNATAMRPNIASYGTTVFVSSLITPGTPENITIRKFDDDGTASLDWESQKQIVDANLDTFSAVHPLVPDSQGGVYVGYAAWNAVSEKYDVTATHFDTTGLVNWTNTFGTAGTYVLLSGVPDGQDGMIMSWFDDDFFFHQWVDAQRVDIDGTAVWNGEVQVTDTGAAGVPFGNNLGMVSDGNGGAYITYRGSAFKTYVQYVTSTGALAFGTGYEPTNSYFDYYSTVAANGTDGVVFTYLSDSNTVALEYLTYVADPPTVDYVDPMAGPVAGGDTLHIYGTYFNDVTDVTIGGTSLDPADYTVVSSTQIDATTPAHASGAVDVSVTTAGGTITYEGGYQYVETPTITLVDPDQIYANSRTDVSITGTNFVGGVTEVYFGQADGEFYTEMPVSMLMVEDSQHLSFQTRRMTAGTYDVIVRNGSLLAQATLEGGFEVLPEPAPTITNIDPNHGSVDGGTVVTITGTGFDPRWDEISGFYTTVTFDPGGVQGAEVGCDIQNPFGDITPTSIICTTQAHVAATVDVQVTTMNGSSGILTYTYEAAGAGGCNGSPGPDQQCAELNLNGTVDVWYDGYGIPLDIQNLRFNDASCSGQPVVVSTTADTPAFTEETCGTLDRTDLVGVVNLRNSAWTLQVQANENFEGPGGAIIPIADNLRVATTGDDAAHFGTVGTMTVSNAAQDDTVLSNNAVDNIWYNAAANSGYTYTAGDVTSPTNTSANLQTLGTYSTVVNTTGVTILSTAQTDAFGIFAVAPAYELDVPAGSPAVTYTNTITYTVS